VKPVIERLTPRLVRDEDGCWLWTGAVNSAGYGVIGLGRKDQGNGYVHRVAYEHFVGPIPAGLVIDHLCRNPRCCEPSHLEPVTNRTNVLRGEQSQVLIRRSGKCGKGLHALPNGGECWDCTNERRRQRRASARLEAATERNV
jgi:hypothetical protein